MAVNDTRIRISLLDDFSSGLQSISQKYDKFTSSLSRTSTSMNHLTTGGHGATKMLEVQGQKLEKVDALMNRVAYSAARYLVVYKGFTAVGDIWRNTIVAGFEHNKMLETNRVGIASILASMTQLNGKNLEWNQAMAMSGSLMKNLQEEALKSGLATDDLVETFRGLLGPGLGAGMNASQILKLSTVGSTAVRNLGLPNNQYLQELRGMVQGGIKPSSSTLATALGITDKDVKAAKASTDGLYKFLMDRLEGFAMASGENQKTITGRLSRLKMGVTMLFGNAETEAYNAISEAIGKVADQFVRLETATDKMGKTSSKLVLNKDIAEALDKVSKRVFEVAEDIKTLWKDIKVPVKVFGKFILNTIDLISQHALAIGRIFLLWKIGSVVKDFHSLLGDTEGAYQATTRLGKAFQFVRNEIFGATNAYKRSIEIRNSFIGLSNEYNNQTNQFNALQSSQNSGYAIDQLSEKWQKMGIEAETADKWQQKVFDTLMTKSPEAALQMKNFIDQVAIGVQTYQAYNEALQQGGKGMMGVPGQVYGDISKQEAAYSNIANSKRAEESVTRLSEKLQALGMTAEEAGAKQAEATKLVLQGKNEEARIYMATEEKKTAAWTAEKQRTKEEIDGYIEKVASADKYHRAIERYKKAIEAADREKRFKPPLATDPNASNASIYYGKLEEHINKLKELGYAQRDIFAVAKAETQAARQGDMESLNAIEKIVEKLGVAKSTIDQLSVSQEALTNRTKDYVSTDWSKLTQDQLTILQFDAETIEKLSTRKDLVQQVHDAYGTLNQAVQDGMLTGDQAHELEVTLLKQVATGYVDVASQIAQNIELKYKEGTLGAENAVKEIQANVQRQAELDKLYAKSLEELSLQDKKKMEFEALNDVEKSGNEKIIELHKRIIANYEKLIAVQKRKGQVTAETEQAELEYLRLVHKAQGNVNQVTQENTIKVQENAMRQEELTLVNIKSISKFAKLAGAVGMTTMALNGLIGEQDSWLGNVANYITQIGFFADAVVTLTTTINNLTKASALAKAVLGFGVVGAVTVGGAYLMAKWGNKSRGLDEDLGEEGDESEYPEYAAKLRESSNFNWNKKEGSDLGKIKDTLWGSVKNTELGKLLDSTNKKAEENVKKIQQTAADADKLTTKYAKAAEDDKKAKGNAVRAAEQEERRIAKQKEMLEQADQQIRDGIIDEAERLASAGTEFGVNGCTAFVEAALKNTQFAELFEGAGRDVEVAVARAKALGIWHEGTKGMKAGDIIAYGNNTYPGGSHVGVYDGNNGVIHNATSADYSAYHQYGNTSMGAGTWINGYIRTGAGNDYESVSKAQIKTLKERTSALQKVAEVERSLREKILDAMDAPEFEKARVKYASEIQKMQNTISNATNRNIDTGYANKLMERYRGLIQDKLAELERKYNDEEQQKSIDSVNRQYGMELITTEQHKAQLEERLADYRTFLNEQLSNDRLSKDERERMENELTDVIKQQHELRASSWEGALRNMGQTLSEYEVDYGSALSSVKDGFSNAFDGMMDGVVAGTKGFMNNIKSAWDDLANSIINQIWKIAMQMYIVKPLFNWLGGILNPIGSTINGGIASSMTSGFESVSFASPGYNIMNPIVPQFRAKGGLANGWTIVGEQGAELVNFDNPGRVYNAQQTAKALGSNPESVRVEIINQSGQDVKADNAEVKFDSKGYIISVVLNAVANNEGGMRSLIKGAAMA